MEAPAGPVMDSASLLVVDDDGEILSLVAKFLRGNGFRVHTARNGVEMTEALGRTPVDLIVLDLMLPGTSGLEGTFQAQEESMRTIGLLSLVSLAMIFAILFARYRSVVFLAIIMTSVPLALIGSVVALWIAGQPLSVASMIGFITLTGIATRNGILKISHMINLAIHEGMPFGRDLVVRGSLERLTPVLMTALSAGVALIPLMIDPTAPGKEVLHPVAVTIFGGLISATLLDTLLTPTLFLRYGRASLERLVAESRHEASGLFAADRPVGTF